MKKIILLSGHSQRFIDKGYTVKPLIRIKNKMIIEYVIDTLKSPEETDYNNYIFIVKQSDVSRFNINNIISQTFPGCTVRCIKDHWEGPVYSVLQIIDDIEEQEEVLISYCDLYIKWDFTIFEKFINDTQCDGCVVSHTGWHPHRVYNKSFAYMKVDGNIMSEIKEKQHYTDEPEREYASGGIYYFRKGLYVKKYFEFQLKNAQKVNNEHYVTMTYNLMINDGLKITHFDSINYVCLGTPKDVEIFQSFLTLNEHFAVSQDILFRAAEYFKQYSFN